MRVVVSCGGTTVVAVGGSCTLTAETSVRRSRNPARMGRSRSTSQRIAVRLRSAHQAWITSWSAAEGRPREGGERKHRLLAPEQLRSRDRRHRHRLDLVSVRLWSASIFRNTSPTRMVARARDGRR
jgi:hypothetical protein